MAKRKNSKARTTISKSQAIRDYKRDNPEAKPREIAAALQAQGIHVTSGRVSTALYMDRQRNGNANNKGVVEVESLQMAIDFISKCGSVEKAQDTLKLASSLGQSFKSLPKG